MDASAYAIATEATNCVKENSMQDILAKIDLQQLGIKLQKARKRQGLTQADAAQLIGIARTTMTAIEKGERRIKAEDLVTLAGHYGRAVSDFVQERPEIDIAEVQFRSTLIKSEEDERIVAPAIEALVELATNYFELEQMVNDPLAHHYPLPYQPRQKLRTAQAAESLAIAERNRLGLGDGPVPFLRDILEKDVGLRIFYLELRPSSVFSEVYFHTPQLGGCIAINSLHAGQEHKGRCRWSLAHAYAHFLAHRTKPTASYQNQYQRKPDSERFADSFAKYFLMPTSGLSQRFSALYQAQGKVTPADLIKLAYYYGVSFQALLFRLEDMRLIPSGVWQKLQDRQFSVLEAAKKLDLEGFPEPTDTLPRRYVDLAVKAYTSEQITEGELAHYLQVDRLDAREIVATYEAYTETDQMIYQDLPDLVNT